MLLGYTTYKMESLGRYGKGRNARDPPTENINPDIAKERKNADFDPVEITNVLDGGRERTERRRFIGKVL